MKKVHKWRFLEKLNIFFNEIRYTIADYVLIAQYTAAVCNKSYYCYGNSYQLLLIRRKQPLSRWVAQSKLLRGTLTHTHLDDSSTKQVFMVVLTPL